MCKIFKNIIAYAQNDYFNKQRKRRYDISKRS